MSFTPYQRMSSSSTHSGGTWTDISKGSGALFIDKDGLPKFRSDEEWLGEFEEQCDAFI